MTKTYVLLNAKLAKKTSFNSYHDPMNSLQFVIPFLLINKLICEKKKRGISCYHLKLKNIFPDNHRDKLEPFFFTFSISFFLKRVPLKKRKFPQFLISETIFSLKMRGFWFFLVLNVSVFLLHALGYLMDQVFWKQICSITPVVEAYGIQIFPQP